MHMSSTTIQVHGKGMKPHELPKPCMLILDDTLCHIIVALPYLKLEVLSETAGKGASSNITLSSSRFGSESDGSSVRSIRSVYELW